MSYQSVHDALATSFRSQWATRQPSWDLSTRVQWPDLPPPSHGRTSWLRIVDADIDGRNTAIGVLDAAVALFTVDIFVPLPEEQADLAHSYALDVRDALRSLSLPQSVRPVRVWKRDFGRDLEDFKHVRMAFAYEYDLPAVA